MAGEALTGLGTQAALVALPYQLYTQTGLGLPDRPARRRRARCRSIAAALLGGAIADRMDRRRLLLLCQLGLIAAASALAAGALMGEPPVWLLYLLGAGLAGFSALEGVVAAGDRAEPRRARAPAGRARAVLRAVPAHGGGRDRARAAS